MKKILENVVTFPLYCEVHMGSIFATLLTCIEKDIPVGMAACEPCINCGGNCTGWTAREKAWHKIANEYGFVSGQSLLLFDMTKKDIIIGDEFNNSNIIEDSEETVNFLLNYAGYNFITLGTKKEKVFIFEEIRKSIDKGVPILMRCKVKDLWLVVIGYDDNMSLYGCGGESYTSEHDVAELKLEKYEDKTFHISNWYESFSSMIIIGDKCKPTATLDDAVSRNKKIMKNILDSQYYNKAIDYILSDENYKDEKDNLSVQAQLIMDFIGVPITGRSITGWFMSQTYKLPNYDEKIKRDCGLTPCFCGEMHEICWAIWRGVGAFEGNRAEFIKRLTDPLYRKILADVIGLARDKDKLIYGDICDYN